MKKENSKIRKLTCVAMVFVTAATVFMVRDFMSKEQAKNLALVQANRNTQAAGNLSGLPETDIYGGMEANVAQEAAEADYAAVQVYAGRYAGTWNVDKYFDGEQWKTYEAGKRMAIVAYNFLNDITITTGGYEKFAGYEANKRTWVYEGTDEVAREEITGFTPVYEYVPEVTHRLPGNGKDIEYSTPAITISQDGVDMSEMGGPIFSLAMFRLETIDGQEYLINDDLMFAITYDGNYLEYCQPDAYGYYQGYYAFN